MTHHLTRSSLNWIMKAVGLACWLTAVNPTVAENREAVVPAECDVDLRNPGMMKDIVSNVLLLSEERPEADVRQFLKGAEKTYATGDELMRAAALHFKIDEAKMAAEVERLRHINCDHAPSGQSQLILRVTVRSCRCLFWAMLPAIMEDRHEKVRGEAGSGGTCPFGADRA